MVTESEWDLVKTYGAQHAMESRRHWSGLGVS